MSTPDSGDRGSAALEVAILAGVILAIIGLIVAAGRVEDAHQLVSHAAEDAARAATQARTTPAAQTAAAQAAQVELAGQLTCQPMRLNLTGTIIPGNTVTATIDCTTALGILPGHVTVDETASAIVDRYRGTG
jgi:Flp pilus assembly protein TadG